MPGRPMGSVLALVHDKPSGRARVRINGRDFWLGTWGSPESRLAYDRLIAEYLATARIAPPPASPVSEVALGPSLVGADVVQASQSENLPAPDGLTVVELVTLYLERCQTYYRDPDRRQTSTHGNALQAARALWPFDDTLAAKFGRRKLGMIRDSEAASGRPRVGCNAILKHVRRVSLPSPERAVCRVSPPWEPARVDEAVGVHEEQRCVMPWAFMMAAMPPSAGKSRQSRTAWICVLETGNAPGLLRMPDKPRVRVMTTTVEPGPALDSWLRRSRRLKTLGATRICYELMPPAHEPGGKARPFRVPEEAGKAKAAIQVLREQLTGQGFTVNGDARVWHVYVIELCNRKITGGTAPPRGFLYVGQTSISVYERARQHQLGPRYPWKKRPAYSRQCHKHFKSLRLDLLPDAFTAPLYSSEAALHAESCLRLYFEAQGYKVAGGTERYPGKRKP